MKVDHNDYPPASEINKSKEKSQISDEYDLIIDIDSIRFLHNPGWNIIFNEKYRKKEDIIKAVKNSKMTIVSVLGNSNRGKTHILQKLSGVNLKPGYQNTTKGLSIKLYGRDIILLDTEGTNAPLLIEDENIEKRPNKTEIEYIHSCKIITNHILQSFVINRAHILICVIGMLTASEQIYLNRIKKYSKKKKKLIVIHNLIKCKTKTDIETYVNDVLKKMISVRLIERNIPTFEPNSLFNKYFIEEDDEDIMHFIYCYDGGDENDKKEDEVAYSNTSTLSFIMKIIKVEVIKPVNIIEDLKTHIQEISSLVLEDEIKLIEEKNDYIKSKNKIVPKNILYDEGDEIIFIGKEYEPKYRYYVKQDIFTIEIELCSKYNNLLIKQKFDKDTKETILIITGERIIEKMQEYEYHFYFENNRENYKRFKLEIKIKLKELGIHHLNKDFEKELKFGILFLRNKFNK